MNRRSRVVLAAVTGVLAVLQAGCPKKEEPPAPDPPPAAAPVKMPAPVPAEPRAAAEAKIAGEPGSAVAGVVTFVDTGNGVAIEARVSGLTPGKHGFHIHEVGDCTGDFSGAGGHFNPDARNHAGPDAMLRHNGDLGNLLANEAGDAMITMLSRNITIDNGKTGILGRSVIVHASEDDLATQPTGNSGARIGCGVIELHSVPAPPADAASTGAPGKTP